MKIRYTALIGVMFLILLILVNYSHVKLLKVNVVFYAALADGLAATAITAAILYFLPKFKLFSVFEKFQLVIIALLTSYIFAISVPTVIDRSLSIYILEKIEQRGGGIQQAGFPQVFVEEYMPEHRLVDVRLTEQLESGTIVMEDGCVKLTAKGEAVVKFSRFYRRHWLPKKRLLMGEYTDDLTDPFRNSTAPPIDYTCR